MSYLSDDNHEYSVMVRYSSVLNPDGSQDYKPDTTYEPKCSCGWSGRVYSMWEPRWVLDCEGAWQEHRATVDALESRIGG